MRNLLIARIARFIIATATKENLGKAFIIQSEEFELSTDEQILLLKEIESFFQLKHKKVGADNKSNKKIGE